MSASDNDTRITLRLSPEARRGLDEIMALGRFATLGEALRYAIAGELALQRRMAQVRREA